MFSMMPPNLLVLASSSPRRRELLAGVGLNFEVRVSGCDESELPGENPRAMVERLALEKARRVSGEIPDAWVLGADTTVVKDGQILGKPIDRADALRMLRLIAGTAHEVWGAFAVVRKASGFEHVESHCSRVVMVPLGDEILRRYWETGEPGDKAGSYAIQGVGASLVERVDGSYTNVVGLNLARVVQLFLELKVVHAA